MTFLLRPTIPLCPHCGAEYVETLGHGTLGRLCSACLAPVGRRKRKHSYAGGPSERRRRLNAVVKRDGWICWICESPVDPEATGDEAPTLDHVLPAARGGTNAISNLRLAHYVCNQMRGCPE